MSSPALNYDSDPVSEFRSAMANAGILSDEVPIADGQLHRFKADGDKTGSKNGWYILFNDGNPAGRFGSWKYGINETWSSRDYKEFTPQEKAEYVKRMAEAKKEREKAQAIIHKEARGEAECLWSNAKPETGDHKYLRDKSVQAYNIRSDGFKLLIPLRDTSGILHSLQTIDSTGTKLFLSDGAKKGNYFGIGKPKDKLIIAEGYSTAASIHEATRHAIAVAFDAGNLLSVAKALRERFPDIEIIIAGDNDQWTDSNPGKNKATEAAKAVNGKLVIPEFTNAESKPTDFNDLATLEGLERVRELIDSAQAIEETQEPKVPNNSIGEDAQQESTAELRSVILDHGADLISRPIALIKEKGYIATWVDMQQGKETIRDVLCILNQDGEIFTAEDAPGNDIKDLNIPVDLPMVIENKKRLSGKGLKKYLDNEKPDPVNVFERLRDYFDHFMDFDLSFSPQAQMSELSACYAISTYLTDAFPVIGYLWPNGETGSGKTHYLITMAEVAYMGQVILAGGTFSSLRDLASYGATLCFDDAEKIMDNKVDPDKQTLLLAGNRKGTTVTFKEQVKNHKWQNKNVHVYCPRLFSAIRLPSETLINRSIIIPLVASGDNRKSNSDPMDYETWPKDIDQRELVDDLWMMALDNISAIPKHDRLVTGMSQINGRGFQPWRAIHTIAHWLTELGADGLYDRMIKVTADYRNEGDLIVPDTKVKLITETLRKLYTKYGATGEIILTSKEICSELTSLARENDLIDEDDKHYLSPRSLGWKLKHMRLKKPETRNERAREWIIDEGTLKRLERPFNLINKTSETSETSETTGNNDVSPENDVNDVNDVLLESDSEHAINQEITILIKKILVDLGDPVSVEIVLGEIVPDDYQYLINDPNYARGVIKTLLERLTT